VSVRNPVSIELPETRRLDKTILIMVNNTNRVKGRDMAKVISLVLIMVIMLGLIGLVACGRENETTPSNGGTAPSGDDSTWDDIPVYSRAKQVQKGSWSISPDEGKWSKVEWRYYETGDSVSTVAAFYRTEMPKKGWQEVGWMETEEMSWLGYSKNNEKDGAIIWIDSEEGKTFIALMRGTD